MKAWKSLFIVPAVAALAMVPQDPQNANNPDTTDSSAVILMSELQYSTPQGNTVAVSARSVAEIRFIEDHEQSIRLELIYDNGDYSLIDAQSFHLLRSGQSTREVRIIRGKGARMRYPRLP